MPLIECPGCGHKVLSVASLCPHCGFSLSAHRKRGQVTCRKCGYLISARQADCPHCGTSSPGSKYPPWVGGAMVAGALILLAGAALWTQFDRFTRSSSPDDSLSVALSGETLALDTPREPSITPVRDPDTAPAILQLDPAYVTQARWASTWVNVREGRSGGTPIVQTLRPGQRLQVDQLQGGWWAVYLDGRFVGYAADNLLLEGPPTP